MPKILGTKKTIENYQLDENPDSPTFQVVYSSSNINRWAKELSGLEDQAAKLREENATGEREEDAIIQDITAINRKIISTMAGEDAYQRILAYMGQGLPESECALALSDITGSLAIELSDRIFANKALNADKYIRDKHAKAAPVNVL